MARHTVVDLSQVFDTRPDPEQLHRLDAAGVTRLHSSLRSAGLEPTDPEGLRLDQFRRMYEPYVAALAQHLKMDLPSWMPPASQKKDNWQTTAWDVDRH
jgi:hypothetical protein